VVNIEQLNCSSPASAAPTKTSAREAERAPVAPPDEVRLLEGLHFPGRLIDA
jgi:hypothetical protein